MIQAFETYQTARQEWIEAMEEKDRSKTILMAEICKSIEEVGSVNYAIESDEYADTILFSFKSFMCDEDAKVLVEYSSGELKLVFKMEGAEVSRVIKENSHIEGFVKSVMKIVGD